jgi:outer membrane protein
MTLPIRASVFMLFIGALSVAPAHALGAQKIAYINSKTVLERVPGRAQVEQALNKELDGYEKQVQAMRDSMKAMIDDYQKAAPKLDSAAKDAREKSIRTKQEEYQGRTQALQEKAQQRGQEVMQPMMEQIRKILDDIRAQDGYAFILDAGADGGVIVAADRNLDITERVISRLKPVTYTASSGSSSKPDSTGKAAPKPPAGPRPTPAGVTRKPQ